MPILTGPGSLRVDRSRQPAAAGRWRRPSARGTMRPSRGGARHQVDQPVLRAVPLRPGQQRRSRCPERRRENVGGIVHAQVRPRQADGAGERVEGMRAPGVTLPMAVAAASDAVAWADGNESWLGAPARRGRRRSRGRGLRTRASPEVEPHRGGGDSGGAKPACPPVTVHERSGERERQPDRTPLAGRAQRLQCLLGGPGWPRVRMKRSTRRSSRVGFAPA